MNFVTSKALTREFMKNEDLSYPYFALCEADAPFSVKHKQMLKIVMKGFWEKREVRVNVICLTFYESVQPYLFYSEIF